MLRRAVGFAFSIVVLLAGTAAAQLITIRTVPVAQADQFDIFPSHNLGMGGVSIALPDTLLDPFNNPAKASRLAASRVFGSPMLYSVSENSGGGRTLPLGAILKSSSWFGGFAAALQEVDPSRRGFLFPGPLPTLDRAPSFAPTSTTFPGPARSRGNAFALAMLGKAIPELGVSVAGSASWASLHAVDGVDMLYARSQDVAQDGHGLDLRLGLLKEWDASRSFEAVVVHNRFSMAHDVTYADLVWDPGTQTFVQVPRVEQNLDRTNTWGLHLEYERPLTASGWRLGWLATGNILSHPKIPNYEIMSIPRDPGTSYAFNVGIGLARTNGQATVGIDAIYEPTWSTTWAEAAAPTPTRLGDTIPAGGRTIENHFRFGNALFRMGLNQELDTRGRAALQFGLMVRSIRYTLGQADNVQVSGRTQDESWVEWTPTWGLSLRFPTLEIRYRGRVTHGTGRPGVGGGGFVAAADAGPRGIIAAPSGPLTLDPVRVLTHQVSISLPLR